MKINTTLYFKIIFISLPFLYSILYAPFGFEDNDTGFIAGLSWQFLTGSIPYTEIIYVRPPASYMFHALPLVFGKDYGLILDRSIFYFEIAIYSYLTILLLARHFKYTDKAYIYFLSILSFILSVHTFPPMGWHTIDGFFFSVIGIYIILTFNRIFIVFFGVLFLIMGALSKQPFYLIPIVMLGYLYLQNNYKKLWIVFLCVIVIFLGFFFYLKVIGAFTTFIHLTSGQTSIFDLFETGFLHYLKSIKFVLFVFIPPIITLTILSKNNSIIHFNHYFFFIILWILLFSFFIYVNNDVFVGPIHSFPDALFIVSSMIVLYKIYVKKNNNYYILLLFLILSWAGSISWGYNTTVFFVAPMIFILSTKIYKEFQTTTYKLYASILIIFSLITFYIGYQNPYNLDHSSKKSDLIYKMDEIYPKLKYIYGDKETYMEYKELKSFIFNYGNNFVVLPDVTLIHYLSNTKNQIGIDWVMNAEINNENNKIITLLEAGKIIVFLKKKELSSEGKFGSNVATHIRKTWKKTNEGKYFDVYISKEKIIK